MARAHQPGCPCCTTDTCCTGGAAPTITIPGYTLSSVEGTGDCCATYTFVPDETVVGDCCDLTMTNVLTKNCLQELYTVQLPEPKVATSNPGCPLPDVYCCTDTSYKYGEVEIESSVELKTYFVARITHPTLKVIWTKEEIDCGSGPECRYAIKVVFIVQLNGALLTVVRSYGSVVGSSTSACFEYDGSLDETWDSLNCPDVCDSYDDTGIENPCWGNNEDFRLCSDCAEASGEGCVQRIRFFSTRPSGSYTFTSSDVIGACDEPVCNWDCSGYDQEVCIGAPDDLLPPFWCDYAPIVTTNSTTYSYLSTCSSDVTVTIVDPFDCCETTNVVCRTHNDCDPPTSFTQNCDELDWNQQECDPLECRVYAKYPADTTPNGLACFCYNSSTLPSYFSSSEACNTAPCNTTCCYEPYTCVPCPYCYPKYQTGVGQYWGDLTITITTNCGLYTKPTDCCWTPPDITLTIS